MGLNDFAESLDSIYIISGIAFDYDGDGLPDDKDDVPRIAKDKPLAIPSHFYKIVVREWPEDSIKALAIIAPHDNLRRKKSISLDYIQNQCLTSIDSIERITGFEFLPNLSESIGDPLEQNAEEVLW